LKKCSDTDTIIKLGRNAVLLKPHMVRVKTIVQVKDGGFEVNVLYYFG